MAWRACLLVTALSWHPNGGMGDATTQFLRSVRTFVPETDESVGLEVTAVATGDIVGDFTITGCMSPADLSYTSARYIIDNNNVGGSCSGGLQLTISASENGLYLHVLWDGNSITSGTNLRDNNIDLTDGKTHSFAIIWESSATSLTMYVDSIAVGSKTHSWLNTPVHYCARSVVGRRIQASEDAQYGYSGDLSQLAIRDVALTLDQMKLLSVECGGVAAEGTCKDKPCTGLTYTHTCSLGESAGNVDVCEESNCWPESEWAMESWPWQGPLPYAGLMSSGHCPTANSEEACPGSQTSLADIIQPARSDHCCDLRLCAAGIANVILMDSEYALIFPSDANAPGIKIPQELPATTGSAYSVSACVKTNDRNGNFMAYGTPGIEPVFKWSTSHLDGEPVDSWQILLTTEHQVHHIELAPTNGFGLANLDASSQTALDPNSAWKMITIVIDWSSIEYNATIFGGVADNDYGCTVFRTTTYDAVAAECTNDQNCVGFYDWGCNNDAAGEHVYKLCILDNPVPINPADGVEDGPACIHVKQGKYNINAYVDGVNKDNYDWTEPLGSGLALVGGLDLWMGADTSGAGSWTERLSASWANVVVFPGHALTGTEIDALKAQGCPPPSYEVFSTSSTTSMSASTSATPSVTPSVTLTTSITPSVTLTTSITPSVTLTLTITPSATVSPSTSPSSSRSPTTSISPSISPSTSATPSLSTSETASLSNGASASKSATPSATPSITPSATSGGDTGGATDGATGGGEGDGAGSNIGIVAGAITAACAVCLGAGAFCLWRKKQGGRYMIQRRFSKDRIKRQTQVSKATEASLKKKKKVSQIYKSPL